MDQISSTNRCPNCGAPLAADRPEGLCPKCLLLRASVLTETGAPSERATPPSLQTLASAFPNLEILELIGQGGMGFVYKARQPQLNRFVALKILPETLARDPAFEARFTREAQALAALSHPNIVTIHDFGQTGGFYFLLMEYIDGVNLRQALRAGRFTPAQALAIVPPICDALQFAHDRGVVHRDIKPENLLLDKTGRVKIADFGIAKMVQGESLDRDSEAIAHTAAGTPRYMAPEQSLSPAFADHRADIYSLGVVLYELLTGELPSTPIQPPSRKVEIDVRLDQVVLRALEKSPNLRWQTATDLRTQLENVSETPPSPPASSPFHKNSSRLAFGLFLAGTLGTLVLMTLSPRHELALIFGGLALAFAGYFGYSTLRERLRKSIVVIVLVLLLGIGSVVAFLRQSNSRAQAEYTRAVLMERMALAQALDVQHKRATPRKLVNTWLGHLQLGRMEEMRSLETSETQATNPLNLRGIWAFDQIKPQTSAQSDSTALVITTKFPDNDGRVRRIAFSLVRPKDRWLISGYAILEPQEAEKRLEVFTSGLEAHHQSGQTNATPQFTPVRELTLPAEGNYYLSLEDGSLHASRALLPSSVGLRYASEVNPQLSPNSQPILQIRGLSNRLLEKDSGLRQWNETTAAQILQDYRDAGFALLPHERDFDAPIHSNQLPLTFLLFGRGLLQVTSLGAGEFPAVTIRYKLVAPENP